jgi:hypothetical protein
MSRGSATEDLLVRPAELREKQVLRRLRRHQDDCDKK